jgi:hypothetical protein
MEILVWKKHGYFASKDLGEYKGKKFRSVMGVMNIRGATFVSCQKEKIR